jgi:transposase-like protein
MSENAKQKWVRRSAAFKQDVLERMSHREVNIKAMAKELGVPRSTVYQWKLQAEKGRRRKAAAAEDPQGQAVRELKAKVAELEGAIGRKTLEADFFAGALRRIEASRQKSASSGATASMPKSAAGCNRKDD